MVNASNLVSVVTLPGSTGFFFVGESFEIYAKEHYFYWERYQRYGASFKTQLIGEKIAVLSEPDAYRDVLLTHPEKFSNYVGWKILEPFIGRGILLEDGEDHQVLRKFMTPFFHKGAIDKYIQVMVSRVIILLETYQGQFVNLSSFLRQYTLPVILSIIFGSEDQTLILKLESLFEEILCGFRDIYRIPIPNTFTDFGKSLIARREIERIIKEQLDKRIQNKHTNSSDLIEIFADAYKSKSLSYEKIVELLLQFLFGGHDTLVNLLFWLLKMLDSHYQIKCNLSDELASAELRTIFSTTTLLHSTINETLRLFPPVPYLPRGVIDEVVVSNLSIPKGWSVHLCPLITHRNPKFFRSPSRFIPERTELKNLQQFTFVPFGTGQHSCLGSEFAMCQVKVFLYYLFKHSWTIKPTCSSTSVVSPFKIADDFFIKISNST
jgi:retinoid hydroxylase